MEDLTRKLRSRSATERVAAVREIAALPCADPERSRLLLAALCDKSNLVVAAAADALRRAPVEKAVAPLMERYWWLAEDGCKRDSGCLARLAIVKALVACRATEAAPIFHHAITTYQPERTGLGMDDTAVPLRGQAAAALAELRLEGALLALSLLLFDEEPRVPHAPEERMYVNMSARVAAARCLAALGEPGGVAVLGVRLAYGRHETLEALVECMDAIAALDPDAAIKMVAPYLASSTPYLVAGAATALAALPELWHDRVIACLSTACANARGELAEPLALALASMRSDSAVPALADLARHHVESVRTAAIAGLRQRGDAASIAALCELA